MKQSPPRPSVFVGSSGEGLRIAQTVQVLLDPVADVEVWSQGVFGLGQGTLESLVLALGRFDFAVLVLTADDLLLSRGVEAPAVRDNVLFELGLFVGGLGRDRTFMVYDRTNPPHLPTDLAGVTAATYALHASGNLQAALGAACTKIQNVVERSSIRTSRGALRLSQAAEKVEGAESTLHELVRLLARSRKVELDIISAQFGPLIEPAKLEAMRSDLQALEAILDERGG
jgi:hypothetical protein